MQTHNTAAKAGGARSARTNAKPVTPAEAKQVWHILAKPSTRKVADWFKAAGRPVRHNTIWKWQRAGWPGTSAADITHAAGAALANIDRVAALSGDAGFTTTDVGKPDAEAKAAQEKSEPPDGRSSAERAEEGLLEVISMATTVCRRIRAAAADTDERSLLLLGGPDGVAKLMMAATAAMSTAGEGLRHVQFLRADEVAAVPGTQTVYPPGEGPHAEMMAPDGLPKEGYYPLRSSMEAYDRELRRIREARGDKACAARDAEPVPDSIRDGAPDRPENNPKAGDDIPSVDAGADKS